MGSSGIYGTSRISQWAWSVINGSGTGSHVALFGGLLVGKR